MRILFLTSRLPFPPVGGDKIRTFNFIKYLSRRHQVTLISFIEHEHELSAASNYLDLYDKLITVRLPRIRSYGNCVKGLITHTPLQVHYYHSRRMAQTIKSELESGYDAILCHLIRMAQYLPEDGRMCKVIDLTDALSLNYQRSKRFRRGWFTIINAIEAKRALDYELAAIQKADKAIFISSVDADYLKNGHNRDKIEVVANGVDLGQFDYNGADYDDDRIVFLGNMRTFPNTDAVVHFEGEIFPLLKQARPCLRFFVVGSEPTKRVQRLHDGKNIFVTGYVHSVVSYLKKAAVMVAPMRAGAGLQNKILEAMAVGTPVITTPIGAEGLDCSKLIIAKTSHEFYQKTLAMIENRDLRQRTALTARKYVEQNFSWENKLVNLENILLTNLGKNRPSRKVPAG